MKTTVTMEAVIVVWFKKGQRIEWLSNDDVYAYKCHKIEKRNDKLVLLYEGAEAVAVKPEDITKIEVRIYSADD